MNKKLAKDLLPPLALRTLSGLFYGWKGNYKTWEKAAARSRGYDSGIILEKVRESALKVKNGEAAYERDSMIFDKIEYNFPLLSSLLWISLKNERKLNILDFGGSLGSSYYQNRFFLRDLEELNWCVVEQPRFVSEGKKNFETDKLHFIDSVGECLNNFKIDVILFSSVLQYLEKPYDLLENISHEDVKYLIIDRTPFVKGNDRITIQKVNPRIYQASYPCWFFNKDKFISKISGSYSLILEFDALDKANINSEFKGFLFGKQ